MQELAAELYRLRKFKARKYNSPDAEMHLVRESIEGFPFYFDFKSVLK